jgi:hypothetical protein
LQLTGPRNDKPEAGQIRLRTCEKCAEIARKLCEGIVFLVR